MVIAARRTPITRAGGALASLQVHELLAPVLGAVAADAAIAPPDISDVIAGNAAGGGGNLARLALLSAGFPVSVPGLTVDRQCGSGLDAVLLAGRLVAGGAGGIFLAGGAESISTAPARAHRLPDGSLEFYDRARHAPPEIGDPEMGEAAENVAEHYGIGRERQDAFALRSHRLAAAAADAGAFAGELVPLTVAGRRVEEDDGARRRMSAQLLARFPAAFRSGGTVTAGNSCGFSDGAAAVAVTSVAHARRLGATEGLVFVDGGSAGVDPNLLGVGAAAAAERFAGPDAVRGAGFIEFNEAFAAQVLASLDLLGVDPDRVNREGGALALGHPYGASGAVLVTRLFHQARQATAHGELALALVSGAGGLGTSVLFRWERF